MIKATVWRVDIVVVSQMTDGIRLDLHGYARISDGGNVPLSALAAAIVGADERFEIESRDLTIRLAEHRQNALLVLLHIERGRIHRVVRQRILGPVPDQEGWIVHVHWRLGGEHCVHHEVHVLGEDHRFERTRFLASGLGDLVEDLLVLLLGKLPDDLRIQ